VQFACWFRLRLAFHVTPQCELLFSNQRRPGTPELAYPALQDLGVECGRNEIALHEIAAELEISVEEYHDWLVEIRGLNVASLEYAGTDHGKDLLHYLPDSGDLPSEALERSELERLLARTIEGIPAIERTVLSLYYTEELTLREIAQVVNLHESRISQLKSQAILRLRGSMAEQWPVARGMVEI